MKKYIIIVFASLFFGGCAVEATDSIPEEAEVAQPVAPYDGAVWIGTEYNWVGGRYAAVPAHWEKPRGQWTRGHWNKTNKGYRWERGRWH